MYIHLFYLLPNKRNTSVLPTETARALAPQSPMAGRRSEALRATKLSTGATWVPRELRVAGGEAQTFHESGSERHLSLCLCVCLSLPLSPFQHFPWLALAWCHRGRPTAHHSPGRLPDAKSICGWGARSPGRRVQGLADLKWVPARGASVRCVRPVFCLCLVAICWRQKGLGGEVN